MQNQKKTLPKILTFIEDYFFWFCMGLKSPNGEQWVLSNGAKSMWVYIRILNFVQ